MNIVINGLTIGEGTKYLIQPPVSGLSKPPIRTSDGDFSGRDGGYVSSQFYSKRLVSITGLINASTCQENEDMRADLQDAMAIRTLLPVFVRTFTNTWYLLEAYPLSLQMDITSSTKSAYKIDLICPEPYLFDGGDGTDPNSGWITQVINKIIGGGYVTPYSLPVQWLPGTTPSIVTNAGDVIVYPQIILDGKWTDPVITNVTQNAFIELNVTTANPSDQIIIDMRNRTITLNGSSILSSRTVDSSWWGLQSGSNTIRLESSGGGDADSGLIRYRALFSGI